MVRACDVVLGAVWKQHHPENSELKVTVRKQEIWVLLTGYLISIWESSSAFTFSSQPFSISLVLALVLVALVVQVGLCSWPSVPKCFPKLMED